MSSKNSEYSEDDHESENPEDSESEWKMRGKVTGGLRMLWEPPQIGNIPWHVQCTIYPFKPPRTHQPGPGIEMEFNLKQCNFNGRDSIKAVEAVMTGVRREMYEYYWDYV